jgi:hypothetical protein
MRGIVQGRREAPACFLGRQARSACLLGRQARSACLCLVTSKKERFFMKTFLAFSKKQKQKQNPIKSLASGTRSARSTAKLLASVFQVKIHVEQRLADWM